MINESNESEKQKTSLSKSQSTSESAMPRAAVTDSREDTGTGLLTWLLVSYLELAVRCFVCGERFV